MNRFTLVALILPAVAVLVSPSRAQRTAPMTLEESYGRTMLVIRENWGDRKVVLVEPVIEELGASAENLLPLLEDESARNVGRRHAPRGPQAPVAPMGPAPELVKVSLTSVGEAKLMLAEAVEDLAAAQARRAQAEGAFMTEAGAARRQAIAEGRDSGSYQLLELPSRKSLDAASTTFRAAKVRVLSLRRLLQKRGVATKDLSPTEGRDYKSER